MDKLNFTITNKADLKQCKEQLLAEKEVQILLKNNNWNQDDIDKNLISFINYSEDRKHCANCNGLYMCNKDIAGYCLDISNQDFSEVLIPCRYLIEEKKLYAHQKNYTICHLSKKELLNNFNNIDLSNEDKYYQDVIDLLKQWLDSKSSKGFYFVGKLGVGKTFLASCLANEEAKRNKKVAFVKVPTFCQQLKSNLDDKDYIEKYLGKAYHSDLLVLDDIGAENTTPWIRDDIILPILDYRMENEKRTLFTSNCTLDELRKRLAISVNGDFVKADRILERIRSLSSVITITGVSRRK